MIGYGYGCGLSLGLLALFDNAIVFRLFTKIANKIDFIDFCVFLASSSFRQSEGYRI